MKRDMDLIRTILLEAEQNESPQGFFGFLIPGYTRDQVAYHVNMLKEAGFVEGPIAFGAGSVYPRAYGITRITFPGHDFLDDIRNDSVWAGVKEKLKRFGGEASLEVIKTLAAGVALELLR